MDSIVRREPLRHCQIIDDGNYNILLVSAQAGQGKTILLKQYAEICKRHTAWCSCDKKDVEVSVLLSKLNNTLRNVLQDFDPEPVRRIASQHLSPQELATLGGRMLAEQVMNQSEPVLLVVDDVHLLADSPACLLLLRNFALNTESPCACALLARFNPTLDGEPYIPFHYCIRIDNELLAFSIEEVRELYIDYLGLSLEQETIKRLFDATKGWGAGLKAIGLAMRDGTLHAHELEERLQDARQLDIVFLQSFLGPLSPDVREEALLLGVLERIPEELLHIVASPKTHDWIQQLAANSDFASQAHEDAYPTFRFHHLFRSFLRKQALQCLTDHRREMLYCEAGRWSLAKGFALEGLEYLAQGQQWEELNDALRDEWIGLLNANQQNSLLRIITNIPSSVQTSYGYIMLTYGACNLASNPNTAHNLLFGAWKIFLKEHDEKGELNCLVQLINYYLLINAHFRKHRSLLNRAVELYERHFNNLPEDMMLIVGNTIIYGICYFDANVDRADKIHTSMHSLSNASSASVSACQPIIPGSIVINGFHGRLASSIDSTDTLYKEHNSPWSGTTKRFSQHLFRMNLLEMAGDFLNFERVRAKTSIRFPQILASSFLGGFIRIWSMDSYISEERYQEALNLYSEGKTNLHDLNHPHIYSQLLHYKALACAFLGRTQDVLEAGKLSLRLRSRVGGTYFIALNRAIIGAAFVVAGLNRSAERMLNKILPLCQESKLDYTLPTILAYRGLLRLRQGRRDMACDDFDACVETLRQFGNMHFFGWNCEIMRTVLSSTVKEGRNVEYARKLGRKRLDAFISKKGEIIPFLRISLLGSLRLQINGLGAIHEIDLKPLNVRLLRYFAERASRLVPYEQIIEAVWPEDENADRGRLDASLSRLRKQLNDAFGPEAGKRYIVMQSGQVGLRHCLLDRDIVMSKAKDGIRLAKEGKLWQAHEAFVHMRHELGDFLEQPFDQTWFTSPIRNLLIEAMTCWVDVLQQGYEYDDALQIVECLNKLAPEDNRFIAMHEQLLGMISTDSPSTSKAAHS